VKKTALLLGASEASEKVEELLIFFSHGLARR
jgi:hypothetical protein